MALKSKLKSKFGPLFPLPPSFLFEPSLLHYWKSSTNTTGRPNQSVETSNATCITLFSQQ